MNVIHHRKTGRPPGLTVDGKAALVVMDAEVWQETQDPIEYAQSASAIWKGLLQAQAGKGMDAEAFFESTGFQEA